MRSFLSLAYWSLWLLVGAFFIVVFFFPLAYVLIGVISAVVVMAMLVAIQYPIFRFIMKKVAREGKKGKSVIRNHAIAQRKKGDSHQI